MTQRDVGDVMWDEARELLDRAERLHRQFFQVRRPASRRPSWEPPVDMFETPEALWILVALVGVEPDDVNVDVEGPYLRVAGERRLPGEARMARIHRLEIPFGFFQRTVRLPVGHFEISKREMRHGCLVLSLKKLG